MKYKLLATEKFDIPTAFYNQLDIDIIDDLWQNEHELITVARGYDALVVRNMTQLNQHIINQLTSIKVIGRLGAGTENIDSNHAKKCGISVVYAPVQNTNAVAEFCVAQIFNALRQIPSAINETKQGMWNRGKYLSLGREISQSTIGIIGFGNIGKALATKMQALGANVLVYNRTATKVIPPFKYSSLETLLKTADIISIHLPGHADTKGFINQTYLEMTKPGAFLLNTSRGDVIDESALLAALESKQLAGALLDVRACEPGKADLLSTHEAVYSTPHIAAFTIESQIDIASSVLTDIIKVLNNQAPNYPVLTEI